MSVIIPCQKADKSKTSVSIPESIFGAYVAFLGSEELARTSVRGWVKNGKDSAQIQSCMLLSFINNAKARKVWTDLLSEEV